jgi:diguanylate cyclase (GGDEF) domain
MEKINIMNFLKLDTILGRIRFYVILVVCIPSVIAALFFFFFQREQIVEAEKLLISEDLYKNRNTVNGYINVCFEDVNFLIRIVQSHRSELSKVLQEFTDYIATHPDIASAAFVGADGNSVIDTLGVTGIYAGDRHYFAEAKAGRSAITTVTKGRISGKPLCFFSAPVFDANGTFDGLVFLSIRLGELDAWMRGTFVPDIRGLVLCDAKGNVLAPASAVNSGKDGAVAMVSAKLMALSDSGQIFVNDAGVRMVGASVDVGTDGWKLIQFQTVDKILASYRWQTLSVSLGALCAILLVMPFILRFCRSIEAPLEELTAYALELRKNDYAQTGKLISHKGMPSELRILFDAFTVMSFRVTRQIKNAEAQSLSDPLTGLYNRRFLQITGADFYRKTLAFGQQCSCFLLDIDHFKKINDTYGHNVGDTVLQVVARILGGSVRQADLLVRYGGEEFVVLATCTHAKQAEELAQRIRQAVAAHSFVHEGHSLNVTVSIGVAVSDISRIEEQVASADDSLLQLLVKADKALYAAKNAGRNAVKVAG